MDNDPTMKYYVEPEKPFYKNISVIAVIILLFLIGAWVFNERIQAKKITGFLGANFGMNLEQIKVAVGPGLAIDVDQGTSTYYQKRNLYNRKARIIYYLHDNKFDYVSVLFEESYDKAETDLIKRQKMFVDIQNKLDEEYGVFNQEMLEQDMISRFQKTIGNIVIEHILFYCTEDSDKYIGEGIWIDSR